MTAALAKLGAAALSDNRETIGWLLAAVLSPIILVTVVLCSVGEGGEEHNKAAISACFYGVSYTEQVPREFREHITDMQTAFSRLDSAIQTVNENAEDGGLDATRVKAVFYALCFGEDAPSRREAAQFVGCFYTTETRTRTVEVTDDETGETTTEQEEYTVNVPVSTEAAYANAAALLEREVTDDDRGNVEKIYAMIAGTADSSGSGGSWLRGADPSVELDASMLANPDTKNAADLVAYVEYAWRSGWGYVWGSYGNVLTEASLQSLIRQYPEMVGGFESVIRAKWMGSRTTDCVGLIKSYGWFDPDALTIRYGTNGMPDVTANAMYYAATESGPVSTMPEIPGLAVWKDGHIGVYVGGGYVVEASGTSKGVVKTKLTERGFTHWLKISYISYEEHEGE